MFRFISFRKISSCKPDCPKRSTSCHGSCGDYREACERADSIAANAKKQMLIDKAAMELKSKNKDRYGE